MDKFAALADPTRRRIMEMLAANHALSASDISKNFSSTPSAISQHLKVLREAELVQMEKRAQQRIYSINASEIEEMEQWLSRMRKFWNDRFDALENLLKADKKGGGHGHGDKKTKD
ncbi:MAG: metalloregulator ArsR/SmtB family transcription factor [Alphaproteobacteria bacterium]